MAAERHARARVGRDLPTPGAVEPAGFDRVGQRQRPDVIGPDVIGPDVIGAVVRWFIPDGKIDEADTEVRPVFRWPTRGSGQGSPSSRRPWATASPPLSL